MEIRRPAEGRIFELGRPLFLGVRRLNEVHCFPRTFHLQDDIKECEKHVGNRLPISYKTFGVSCFEAESFIRNPFSECTVTVTY